MNNFKSLFLPSKVDVFVWLKLNSQNKEFTVENVDFIEATIVRPEATIVTQMIR